MTKARIYLIRNGINNKGYVGFTTQSLRARFGTHLRKSEVLPFPLHQAIKKYGRENFTIQELETFEVVEEGLAKEEWYIQELNTRYPNGYNVAVGGKAPGLGRKQSKEEIEKRAASNRGKKRSDEFKRRLSEQLKGKPRKPHSEETKQKMSKSRKGKPGKPHTEETKLKISAMKKGNKNRVGKTLLEEHKQAISKANTGRKVSEETRAKLSIALKGKPKNKRPSEETKLKMGAANKGKTWKVVNGKRVWMLR